jgi:hypothetical protein
MTKKSNRKSRVYGAPQGYLVAKDSASRAGVGIATWRRWQALGIGPAATRIGGRVLWRTATIDAWLLAQEGRPRSAAAIVRSPVRRSPK